MFNGLRSIPNEKMGSFVEYGSPEKMETKKVCKYCKKDYYDKNIYGSYCSYTCRTRARRKQRTTMVNKYEY